MKYTIETEDSLQHLKLLNAEDMVDALIELKINNEVEYFKIDYRFSLDLRRHIDSVANRQRNF